MPVDSNMRLIDKMRNCRVSRVATTYLGVLLFAVGTAAFFSGAVASGLPPDFNFPIGFASHSFQNDEGNHIVYDRSIDRVQIYNPNWDFIRGFPVFPLGGSSKATLSDDGMLIILKRRSPDPEKIIFSIDGTEISRGAISAQEFLSMKDSRGINYITTPIYLLPFTNPLVGWIMALIGSILLLRDKLTLNRKSGEFSS